MSKSSRPHPTPLYYGLLITVELLAALVLCVMGASSWHHMVSEHTHVVATISFYGVALILLLLAMRCAFIGSRQAERQERAR